ncbi:hypothetical protein J6590_067554 [Homalodisca vitripennis]|nr:hypothetical protein J6590_067554 [Homalodisca vitripennis]
MKQKTVSFDYHLDGSQLERVLEIRDFGDSFSSSLPLVSTFSRIVWFPHCKVIISIALIISANLGLPYAKVNVPELSRELELTSLNARRRVNDMLLMRKLWCGTTAVKIPEVPVGNRSRKLFGRRYGLMGCCVFGLMVQHNIWCFLALCSLLDRTGARVNLASNDLAALSAGENPPGRSSSGRRPEYGHVGAKATAYRDCLFLGQ